MDIVLIGGLWLPSHEWAPTVSPLAELGHRALVVDLPGQDDDNGAATLSDQLDAALTRIDEANRPLVVGHSAAATLAWMVADVAGDRIAGVAFIGGIPQPDGASYADFFPAVDGWMQFPGWEPFSGPDSADLNEETKLRLQAALRPVAATVSQSAVSLCNPDRFGIPVTIICPEFSPAEARAWIDGGEVPELTQIRRIKLVDIDSGHWPMVSCPNRLAVALDEVAHWCEAEGVASSETGGLD
ncbi:alpha/beta fold hydrolase [Gulosibacter sp. GYB002]|uniref:alpha/beta fold hydrolase n=1 Tax=Gulosibacter sp. GYB002 TaxID=2994391 RepID=UPI002F964800